MPIPVVVSLVMVPPHAAPLAWGHMTAGTCVQFTGTREAMLALFHRLRDAGRQTPPSQLVVDSAEWQDVTEIPRGDCPIHRLPEIEAGSEVAFAPY